MFSTLETILDASVSLRVLELQSRGGPTESDFERIKSVSLLLAEKGDILQFGSKKRGEVAGIFNQVADALAVMAFVPGGIRFGQCHWQGKLPMKTQRIVEIVPPNPDRLEQITRTLDRVRDLKLEAAALEERLKWVQNEIKFEEKENLPDMFHAARVKGLDLPQDGNKPAYYSKLKPYYSAGIAASWPVAKQNAAFDYLERTGNGALIKATVTVTVPTKAEQKRKALFDFLQRIELDFEPKLAVHHKTLTAWLQAEVEKHGRLPNLDLIGGDVGEIVKVEPKEDK